MTRDAEGGQMDERTKALLKVAVYEGALIAGVLAVYLMTRNIVVLMLGLGVVVVLAGPMYVSVFRNYYRDRPDDEG